MFGVLVIWKFVIVSCSCKNRIYFVSGTKAVLVFTFRDCSFLSVDAASNCDRFHNESSRLISFFSRLFARLLRFVISPALIFFVLGFSPGNFAARKTRALSFCFFALCQERETLKSILRRFLRTEI